MLLTETVMPGIPGDEAKIAAKTYASDAAVAVLQALGHDVVCETDKPPTAFACWKCPGIYEVAEVAVNLGGIKLRCWELTEQDADPADGPPYPLASCTVVQAILARQAVEGAGDG